MEQESKEIFNWKDYLDRIKARGYEILTVGKCPNCSGKACQIHNDGVIHTKCENDDFHNTGFGGPNVKSWGESVAWGKLSQEEQQAQKEKERKEIEEKQERFRNFLLGK